jgi:hypothetical protein
MKVYLFYEKMVIYMSTNLIVEKKNVYGVERVYPVCNKAKILTALTGNKTLLDVDIKLIKQLGYTLTTKREEL